MKKKSSSYLVSLQKKKKKPASNKLWGKDPSEKPDGIMHRYTWRKRYLNYQRYKSLWKLWGTILVVIAFIILYYLYIKPTN